MMNTALPIQEKIKAKAQEIGLSEEAFFCTLNILSRNRDMVNALDNCLEMDDYIYRALIKAEAEKRKQQAETDKKHSDEAIKLQAEKNLTILSKDELNTDAYYRAVLPLIVKVVQQEPILRLHADVAVDLMTMLAEFKRKYRVTSITEVIVTKCKEELDAMTNN